MTRLTYGKWLLEDTFGESAKTPGFFDNVKDEDKNSYWTYYLFCPKDLSFTNFVAFDPEGPGEPQQRVIITQCQYEAFEQVITSIAQCDHQHDGWRLSDEHHPTDSEGEQALHDIRYHLDKVAALVLKHGPYKEAMARTLDLRLAFIHELVNYPNLPAPRNDSKEFRNWTDQKPLIS